MIESTPETFLTRAIQSAFRVEAARIVEQEAAAAQKRVAERLAGMIDQLALQALSRYRIERNDMEVIIRVDRRELTPPAP